MGQVLPISLIIIGFLILKKDVLITHISLIVKFHSTHKQPKGKKKLRQSTTAKQNAFKSKLYLELCRTIVLNYSHK
jgi:hypothetical protein